MTRFCLCIIGFEHSRQLPFSQPTGTWLDQTLRTRWESTTKHACKWTGRSVLCYPSECKVNPSTLQPRRRATFKLLFGWTIHDQDVTVVQPNRRGNFTRRATNLELLKL